MVGRRLGRVRRPGVGHEFRPLAPVIRHHHERVDGGGYPDGLQGKAMPLGARIVAACDAYDAMANTRQYREGMGADRVWQHCAMIKLTFCLRRRPDLSIEEFHHYWRDTHAPLVAARADVLGIRRYVQVHTADHPGLHEAFRRRNDGAPEPYDGVAELWFDDLAAFGRDDPRGAAGERRSP